MILILKKYEFGRFENEITKKPSFRMSAVVNRVLSGGQRATRKTINAFVGKNNFALQDRNSKKLSS